jgi:hypothetical protein
MRRHMFGITLSFVTVLVLATSITVSENQYVGTFNVPFGFDAGTVNMPAGRYYVRIDPALNSIMIRNTDGSTGAFVLVNAIHSKDIHTGVPTLVFNRYGSQHFLAKVYAIDGLGCGLFQGKLEKELIAKSGKTQPAKVNVAMEKR